MSQNVSLEAKEIPCKYWKRNRSLLLSRALDNPVRLFETTSASQIQKVIGHSGHGAERGRSNSDQMHTNCMHFGTCHSSTVEP